MVLRLRTLLILQAAFMLGFAAVVPYLAVIAQDRFAFGAAAVGLIVGSRVAAQQGLFVAGGALADRFGPRPLIILGCAVRALGLALVGTATAVALFAVGVVLVGAAGALFSPALESLVGGVDAAAEPGAGASPFAALALVGEAGGVVGLAVGAMLIPGRTAVAALAAAAVFLVVLVVATRLPRGPVVAVPQAAPVPVEPAPRRPDTRWMAVLVVCAGALLAVYTQLITVVPIALERRSLDVAAFAQLLVLYSVLVLVLQWPVARLARRWGPRRAIPGALLSGAAAGVVAAAGERLAPHGSGVLVALGLSTALVAVAMTLGGPAVLSFLSALGRPERRGLRLGALATAGGVLALALSALTGSLVDHVGAAQAWLAVVLFAGLAALGAHRAVTRLACGEPLIPAHR